MEISEFNEIQSQCFGEALTKTKSQIIASIGISKDNKLNYVFSKDLSQEQLAATLETIAISIRRHLTSLN